MSLEIIAVVFGVIFVAELPDKSMFASLVLSTRFRKSYMWAGAATAFLIHVIIAVTAGHLMTLLPHKLLEIVVGVLFLLGAGLLTFGKDEDGAAERKKLEKEARSGDDSFIKAFGMSFAIIFLGEWGDITQIATANYAARYHDPVSVGIGATLGLWSVTALGILLGTKLLDHVPGRILQRITAGVLCIFAVLSFIAAVN